ncbi:bifunctional DNA primase/polymerase [Streptomyces sp. FXJ1.172]|uniref:bifunctional DNA primase/polymerase n=1 Tax=Streptomyces sp. FXJ1.172 TaxID=710705 RepID=UPI0023DD12B5|nr:bifunctional DNA primase/polymerase [Streptomyces sp. FXJ1.172]WEP00940.1 bifunctional DNA primase/polymerase [Streptomyces sp. FXJ1.172]
MPGPPQAVARWCAAQGWPVHPLAPGRKTPVRNCPACSRRRHQPAACPCLPAGRPCHGFRAATADPVLVERWWADNPSAGVGVACGPAELVVIDIDAHQAPFPDRAHLLAGIPIPEQVRLDGLASGFDTLALLAAYRGETSPAEDGNTLRVRTPSGGLHVWYRNPDSSVRYRCSTGSARHTALAWQVDVRADGGYIVAPGTRTPRGVYRAEGTTRHPAVLPEWLQRELRRTGHLIEPRSSAVASTDGPLPRGLGRSRAGSVQQLIDPLIALVAQCAAAPEGTGFSEKLNRAAYTAGGLVGSGHLHHAAVRDRLLRVAHYARPRQQARNEKIVDHALAVGAVRPLHLKGRP